MNSKLRAVESDKEPPEPWRSFLRELDTALSAPVALHCIGGFVVTQQFGIGRTTSDIDFVCAAPYVKSADIEELAGKGSKLHKQYRLYMQYVSIATAPADYETRLIRMFPSAPWKYLTLHAMEAHDIALAKLERNVDRDREDVLELARAGHIQAEVLKQRYYEELQPYLIGNVSWHDKTLELWLAMIGEIVPAPNAPARS